MDWNLIGYVASPFIALAIVGSAIFLALKGGSSLLDWLDEEDK